MSPWLCFKHPVNRSRLKALSQDPSYFPSLVLPALYTPWGVMKEAVCSLQEQELGLLAKVPGEETRVKKLSGSRALHKNTS